MYNETTQETIARIQSARRLGCRACIFFCIQERDFFGLCYVNPHKTTRKEGNQWCERWLRNPDVSDEQEHEVKF